MANHVTNILTVNGSQDELIIDSLFNEENEIDFDTFAPMPEELRSVTSPVRIVTKSRIVTGKQIGRASCRERVSSPV